MGYIIVAAFAGVAARRPDARLVLTGGEGPSETLVRSTIDAYGLADRVVRTGRIPEADLDLILSLVDSEVESVDCSGARVLTQDIDIANALADRVIASYGQFHPRVEVDKSSQGKVLYAHPGSGGTPTFVIYEVTDAGERARIVNATRQALRDAHAASATLKFYERQNVTHFEGGGIRRGPEQLIETVVVKPD